ncbi:hypothetical protein [uncultured Croceitalea sp.]|uniref:hypothetical protein n=1 Tax=uncultured Croceitalea sp. TaxID=1798908 RepID=UPI0033068EE5
MKNKSRFRFVFFFLVLAHIGYTQEPRLKFFEKDPDTIFYEKYAHKKRIPLGIKQQAYIALSYYPELKDTRITFRFRKRKTPLTSRPRFFSVFLPKHKRAYVITISTKTKPVLTPILFTALPYNAQIGVLGHEIGHIVEYKTRSSFQLIGLAFKISNSAFADKFEFDTDERTIAHGLGYQLLDWSKYVRQALGIAAWKGANEKLAKGNHPKTNQRYMNPETIEKYIATYTKYSKE